MSQRLFTALGKTHFFFKDRAWLTKPVHQFLERWVPTKTEEDYPWEDEAENEIKEQETLRAKKILYSVGSVLGVLYYGLPLLGLMRSRKGRVRSFHQSKCR